MTDIELFQEWQETTPDDVSFIEFAVCKIKQLQAEKEELYGRWGNYIPQDLRKQFEKECLTQTPERCK